jgi:acyl-CoA reductase-like NAD-dependent aldehyde dehydrogenase
MELLLWLGVLAVAALLIWLAKRKGNTKKVAKPPKPLKKKPVISEDDVKRRKEKEERERERKRAAKAEEDKKWDLRVAREKEEHEKRLRAAIVKRLRKTQLEAETEFDTIEECDYFAEHATLSELKLADEEWGGNHFSAKYVFERRMKKNNVL